MGEESASAVVMDLEQGNLLAVASGSVPDVAPFRSAEEIDAFLGAQQSTRGGE